MSNNVITFIIIIESVTWFFYWIYLLRLFVIMSTDYITTKNTMLQFIKYTEQNQSLPSCFWGQKGRDSTQFIRTIIVACKLCTRMFLDGVSSSLAVSSSLSGGTSRIVASVSFVRTHASDASAWSAWLASHSRVASLFSTTLDRQGEASILGYNRMPSFGIQEAELKWWN